MELFTIVIIILAFLILIPSLVYHLNKESVIKFAEKHQIALIVTAHPDDECMFFSPTIIALLHNRVKVHILCLSSGNYNGIGKEREKEFFASCRIFGLQEDECTLVDEKQLPDDPKVTWNPKVIAEYVEQKIKEVKPSIVLTFDKHGVSGHLNHKSLNEGVRFLIDSKRLHDVKPFELESVPLCRKYLGILDVSIEHLTVEQFFTANWFQVTIGQRAMLAHWSQFVWFRVLYIFFSRYMIINTLIPMDSDKQSSISTNK